MKVVAVTGGTGFVGKATIKNLVDAGWHVRALTRESRKNSVGINWVVGRLDDRNALTNLCDGADAVLHIAGLTTTNNVEKFEQVNVNGTQNIVEVAKQLGIRRFVHVSSLAARNPNLSAYGASKLKAERIVETSLLDWTIIRPPAVYGPDDKDHLLLYICAEKLSAVPLSSRGNTSQLHVRDLARALEASLNFNERLTARTFEIDDGRTGGWELSEFARAIGLAAGKKVCTFVVPKWALLALAKFDEWRRRQNARLTIDRVGYLVHDDWVIDVEQGLPADIWCAGTDLYAGTVETYMWYKANDCLKWRHL